MLTVVTGAHGFLGRHIVSRLAADGHQVLAVDRKAFVGQVVEGVQYHLSDLEDPATLIPPDCEPVGRFALVHLAWDLRSRETSYKVQSEQVTTLAGLLDTWTGKGLSYVIAPGSAQEYGAKGGVLAEGVQPEEPLSPYGWAKRATFEMASSWSRRSGVGLLWLRPFIIYGPGQAGSMLVPYAVRQAMHGEQADFTDGKQTRDFVYVDDVVEAFSRGLGQQPQGIHELNLGSRDPVQVCDVLAAIADQFQARDNFHFGAKPRRLAEPDVQVADCTRAEQVLGWTPQVGWREGVRRICDDGRWPMGDGRWAMGYGR